VGTDDASRGPPERRRADRPPWDSELARCSPGGGSRPPAPRPRPVCRPTQRGKTAPHPRPAAVRATPAGRARSPQPRARTVAGAPWRSGAATATGPGSGSGRRWPTRLAVQEPRQEAAAAHARLLGQAAITSGCTARAMLGAGRSTASLSREIRPTHSGSLAWPLSYTSKLAVSGYLPLATSKTVPSALAWRIRPPDDPFRPYAGRPHPGSQEGQRRRRGAVRE
jgi:hypothetical protein